MRLAADLGARARRAGHRGGRPAAAQGGCGSRPSLPRIGQRALDRFVAVHRPLAARACSARAASTAPTAATACSHGIAKRWRDAPARRALPSPRGSPPRRPPSRALLAQHRAPRPRARSSCPALALSSAMPRRRMGRAWPATRSGRGRRNPPAISSEAPARPDRRGARRSGAVAGHRSGGVAGGARPRGRPCHDRRRLHRQMERASPPERRLTGVRCAELADGASEAQAIALALREALETPGRTAALVTPDRTLGRARVGASGAVGNRRRRQRRPALVAHAAPGRCCSRWPKRSPRILRRSRRWRCSSIRWSAGRARSGWRGSMRCAISTLPCAGRDRAPALPGSTSASRRSTSALIDPARAAAGRGRRVRPTSVRGGGGVRAARHAWRPCRRRLREAAGQLAGERGVARSGRARRGGPDRRARASASAGRACAGARTIPPPCLRELLAAVPVRPPYGGHPRISIWGLLEARLQQADLMILGGMNEGDVARRTVARPVACAAHPPRAGPARARPARRACGA